MENLIRYTPILAQGALVTIALAVLSLALATLLGALGAAGGIGGGRTRPGARSSPTPPSCAACRTS